jgi:hypothetical protein
MVKGFCLAMFTALVIVVATENIATGQDLPTFTGGSVMVSSQPSEEIPFMTIFSTDPDATTGIEISYFLASFVSPSTTRERHTSHLSVGRVSCAKIRFSGPHTEALYLFSRIRATSALMAPRHD